ncbi:protealysin inhibitor emfourin [Streptomyces sp. NPDC049687]|uniref:protealysin inhibitor emfourin n=1 Tax=Streptomyces sp. NPDC049687 TaxID=3365596 RepID=UPI0037ABF389
MRIRLIRSGGLLGMPRRAEADTSDRSDGAELERLAHEVLAETEARPSSAPGVPDGYQYTLTVDDGPPAEFTDPGLTDAQLSLVERVLGEGF